MHTHIGALAAHRRHLGQTAWWALAVTTLLAVAAIVLAAGPASAPAPATAAGSGDAPLAFVPNRGQTDPRVRYLAQTGGASFFFTRAGATLAFGGDEAFALKLRLEHPSADLRLTATDRTAGRVSYLNGRDASHQQRNLPTYAGVAYTSAWPGIDLRMRGAHGALKYEFSVAPGADPSRIGLAYAGASGLSVGGDGSLRVSTSRGTLTDAAPVAYQRIGGRRVPVDSRYALRGDSGYGFALGRYDHSRPLVIDPALEYSTFLGGTGFDSVDAVATDAAGATYVAGQTTASNFPTTAGAFDQTDNADDEAFVTKFTPSGTLAYSTYIGGDGPDRASGLAIDSTGAAYVAGGTWSTDFPTTPGAYQTSNAGDSDARGDAFVLKLAPTGSSLLWSTYLGGSDFECLECEEVAIDPTGAAYVSGYTDGDDYPTTPGAFDTSADGFRAGFVTKVAAGGGSLVYSTYLEGSFFTTANDIAVDSAGAAYVTGTASDDDFPTTAGAFDTTFEGTEDAYVTKLAPSGSTLIYSTFLGGDTSDTGSSLAIDAAGAAYVTGGAGDGFPTTAGAFDTTYGGSGDGFVAKVAPGGGSLAYSTYLGGDDEELLDGIAVDGTGAASVGGTTASTDFPTTPGAFDTSHNGADDAFAARFSPTGALVTSTLLGGASDDLGRDVALAPTGRTVLVGATFSTAFPVTGDAFDATGDSSGDGFVTRLDLSPCAGPGAITDTDNDHKIKGTAGDDLICGDADGEQIQGLGGNDQIYGNGGNDSLDGGPGNDHLDGGDGADSLMGGAGADEFVGGPGIKDLVRYVKTNPAPLVVDMNSANGANDGANGEHDSVGDDVENLQAGAGNDFLSGNAAHNTMYGRAGGDLMQGGPGADAMYGEEGADQLFGNDDGSRRDILNCGPEGVFAAPGPNDTVVGCS